MVLPGFDELGMVSARCNGQCLSDEDISLRLAKHLTNTPIQDLQVGWRKAAVLVPLLCRDEEWQILYTRRTDHVPHHKGQVSFPGGAYENQDADLIETALRESCEEIGLAPDSVQVLGQLPGMPTVSNYVITPIVGRITRPFKISLSEYEVSRVFTIPLSWLADSSHREMRPYQALDGRVFDVIFYQPYDDEILWGATAYMTVKFLEALGIMS